MQEFKLKIPNTEKYWTAFIAENNNEMYKAVEDFKEESCDKDFAAITCPFDKYTYDDTDKNDIKEIHGDCIGHVYFSEDCLGAGLVSHELLHIALSCERRLNSNPDCELGEEIGEAEERVAYLLTKLVDQFVDRAYV